MKYIKKTDFIIILVILVISIASWTVYKIALSDKPALAEIYYNNTLIQTVDLNKGEEKTFSIPQNRNVVFHLYKDGSIRFEESDCPDKVCINTGRLNTVGQYAACLPNKIVLKIVSKNNNKDDENDIVVVN